MSIDNPSIDDLLHPKKRDESKDASEDETAQSLLTARMKNIGLQNKERETEERAKALSMPYVNLQEVRIDLDALKTLSHAEAQALNAVVFLKTEDELRIGTIEPTDAVKAKLEELSQTLHRHGVLYLISQESLRIGMQDYSRIYKAPKTIKKVNITAEDIERVRGRVTGLKGLGPLLIDSSLTDAIVIVLATAIESNASDVHIEAEEEGVKLRFRIDGVLQDAVTLPREMWEQLISRIKILAALKLNITTQPQDGHLTIMMPNDRLDIRVSTIPTAFGESVVMRILRGSAVGLKFEDLGLRGKAFEDLKREIMRPNGMILSTGPTGAGKTTTLYAILNKLNDAKTKIITLEDPIEYQLPGINQSQVDREKKYTFASGLRSIVRQDPDIIMVGEIRDIETADVAINAALTGHLVLSTQHTNAASGSIPRFLAMGVKPFLLAPAINAVIGQRLVRRICEKCKESYTLEDEQKARALAILEAIPRNSGYHVDTTKELTFYRGKKCEKCHETGYKGRIGIFEIFSITPEIERMILSDKVSEYDINAAAQKAGMITMAQDGMLKAIDGITTVDEVFRVSE